MSLEILFKGVSYAMALFIICEIFFEGKEKDKKHIAVAFLLYLILFIINQLRTSCLFSVLMDYLAILFFIKMIYDISLAKIVFSSLMIYFLYFFSFQFFLLMEDELNFTVNMWQLLGEEIIILMLIFITFCCRKALRWIIGVVDGLNNKSIFIFVIAYFLLFCLIIFNVPRENLNMGNFIDFLMVVFTAILGIVLINNEKKIRSFSNKYIEAASYASMNEKLVEEYRYRLHENKNQLLIIKNLCDGKSKELNDYIDDLIDIKSNVKHELISDLKHIALTSLKNFINFKIMEIEKKGINIELVVSPNVENFSFDTFTTSAKTDLHDILGIFLDNAIDAASESVEKMIGIHIYLDNENLKIIIANTYIGVVRLDKVYNCGYSSKGVDRGMGLYIAKELIDKNVNLDVSTRVIEQFFVQELTAKSTLKTKNHDI